MTSLQSFRSWLLALALVASVLACTADGKGQVRTDATATDETQGTASVQSSTADAPLPAVATLQSAFSGQRAYEHDRQLAEVIGSRPAGSQKERDAANYIAATLRSYGYQVEKPPFTFQSYRPGDASVQVTAASPPTITARPLYFSPGGDVSGPLVAAGLGRPEDFPQQGLAGKVALIQRGAISFADKVANAVKASTSAVIIYNNSAGPFEGIVAQGTTIPAIGISQEDGDRLLGLVQQGAVNVRLSVTAGFDDIASQNVTTRNPAPCKIVVGGHYDSVPAGPGANDNGSGTSTILELARVFKDHASRLGFCFAAFGGEELGLWGSRRYVEALSEEQKSALKAMINLDMVGVGDTWRIGASKELMSLVQDAAADQEGTVREFSDEGSRGSDHASFIRAGIRAVFFYRSEDPRYHSPEDKVEFVDPEALDAAGKMAVKLLMALVEEAAAATAR